MFINSVFIAILIVGLHYIFEKERFRGRGIKVPVIEIIVLTIVVFRLSYIKL